MMRKLMILGASILQLPAIIKAKEMGLFVIAVDMDKNAVGFKEADMCLEISTIDIPQVIKAAKEYRIDGIMTLASDMPIRTVAAVAKELNLVGVSEETALKATNKALMRECLKLHNVPVPIFFRSRDYDDYLNAAKQIQGKFIVKPADNSGSRGVFLVDDIKSKEMVKYAFEYSKNYSRSGEIVVEEYMEGPEVSVETLSVGGSVHIIAITDKLTTGAPRFVEMGHSQPSRLSDDTIRQIEIVANAAVKAIGIMNGPSHTEIIITNEGPKIVELGARLGGDNITTHLVPLSTGVNMIECCIKIALGIIPNFECKFAKASAIRYFETEEGIIQSITGIEATKMIDEVREISFVHNVGEKIGKIQSSIDRVGFVIAQSSTVDEAIRACEMAKKMITIKVGE
jgi:biotin carboxylase